MPGAPCIVYDCYKDGKSKHRFPNPAKDKVLFDKWVLLCGNRRLASEVTPENVYNNYRVCSLHFLPEDFGFNGKLKKGVWPSLKLPNPLEPAERKTCTLKTVSGEIQDYAVAGTSTQSSDTSITQGLQPSRIEDQLETTATTQGFIEPVPKTPKRRSTLLSQLHVSQVKDLTPKGKCLYETVRRYKKKKSPKSK